MSKQNLQKRTIGTYFKQLASLFFIFFKIGLFSFGGGYAMLTLIENEVVEKRKWLTHNELADIFAIAESTPGPIAINTATFIGTKQLGILGGIIATLGVVIPAFSIIVGLSYIINLVNGNKWVEYLFKGIRVGVLVLIAKAVISFYKDMRKNLFSFALMIAAFLLVFLTDVSVIYIILGTIVICSLAVAFTSLRNSKRYHKKGTPEYREEASYNPETDTYIPKSDVYDADLYDKHSDNDSYQADELITIINDDGNQDSRSDDGGEV